MLNKIVFIDYKEENIPSEYLGRIKSFFTESIFTTRDNPDLLKQVGDAEAFLVTISTKVDKELLDVATKLKYVGVCSTAFDAVDAKYAKEKGVFVCNLGGYSTEAVAEFFFAVLFENIREIEKAKVQARLSDFSFANFMGLDLKNKTLGVIGAGQIGSRVAEIGIGIGMNVIYFSRENKERLDKIGATKKDLDDVIKESDFISLNLSLNSETKNIINRDKINQLKPSCVFVSLSPPSLIDQEAIMEQASGGKITFIFDHSDDIDNDLAKKFLATKNCIVYPPVAFRTKEANTARWETLASNVENFINGSPKNVVNP